MAGDETKTDPLRQCAVAVLILGVCGVFATQVGDIYVEATDAGLGARGLPVFVLVTSSLLAAALLLQNVQGAVATLRTRQRDTDLRPVARVAGLAILSFGYIWAITLFQYALPTVIVMAAILYLFGGRGIVRLVVIPIVAVACYWFVFFVLLGIFEEPGRILQYDSYTLALKVRQALGLQ